jgi:uncharacterized protein YdaU (DUF1376 family)
MNANAFALLSLIAEQGLLEDVHAERLAKAAEDIPEVDEHGKKLTKKQQAAAKKKADADRTRQTQDEGTRIDPKVTQITLSFVTAKAI